VFGYYQSAEEFAVGGQELVVGGLFEV